MAEDGDNSDNGGDSDGSGSDGASGSSDGSANNRLHQMTMSYVAAEDRVMFRLSTTTETEYRMWFTRRFLKVLWGALVQVLERHPSIRDDMTREVKDAVIGMQHQEAVQQADFEKPHHQGNADLTSNTGPLLITGGQLVPGENGLTTVKLTADNKQQVSFNLNEQLLHAFCHLMVGAAVKAEWDLDLTVGDGNVVVTEESAHQVH